jgi:hypothetical protein
MSSTSGDGSAIAALTVLFSMLIDQALESPGEAAKIKIILDRALLLLERKQFGHPSPETVSAARSQIESLLQVLATSHPAAKLPWSPGT